MNDQAVASQERQGPCGQSPSCVQSMIDLLSDIEEYYLAAYPCDAYEKGLTFDLFNLINDWPLELANCREMSQVADGAVHDAYNDLMVPLVDVAHVEVWKKHNRGGREGWRCLG